MAINLNSSAAQAARNSVQTAEQNKNKPADGFEDGMDLGFDDLMAAYNSENFGSSDGLNGSGFDMGLDGIGTGAQSTGQNLMNPIAFGGGAQLGQGMNGLGINNQLGQLGQTQTQAPKKVTASDVIGDMTTEAVKATGSVVKDFVKSLKGVSCDDLASLSMDVLIAGIIIAVLGVILLLSSLNGNPVVKAFAKLFLPSGLYSVSTALIGVALTGFGILSKGEPEQSLATLPDTPVQLGTQSLSMDSLDAEYDALLDSFYDDDEMENEEEDDFFNTPTSTQSSSNDWGDFFNTSTAENNEPQTANNDALLDSMNSTVAKIDRAYLLEQFIRLLPENCKNFGQTTTISSSSDEFISVRSLLLQALSNISKIPVEELPVDLEKLESTTFSYTMTVGRIKGITKLQDIAEEIQVYFRENANDIGVIASVEIEHGYYKISLTKGITEMVTVRDCLNQPTVKEYFSNTKNLLPFIAGIDTYGNPILASGENYTAMMTAGKQRSGKSWYITSVLMTFMTFNLPTDVQFLFIDPKKSSLYRMFSCMPHTIGVHDDEDIVSLLKYVINVEGERRKEKLRAANKGYGVDSIKDYRKEGHEDMPYLYVVIDEYLTAISNVEAKGQKKEFNQLINMIITQLPFVGIHLWFVPHRAQGAVDKTSRANIMFTSAFRCENNIVEEVLDTKWTRPLKNPGDMAIKLQDIGKEMFARAAVFTTSDEENTRVIKDIAKAWYKIGADVPNVDYGILANKDFDYIGAMLGLDDNQVKTLKIDALGGTSNSTYRATQKHSGMPTSEQFALEHRQNSSILDDFLNVDDEQFISDNSIEKSNISDAVDFTDEDEEMLTRWRQSLSQEEQNNTSAVMTGWEDESNIFDD